MSTINEQAIDGIAALCIDGLQNAIEEGDGEMAAIFSATGAALCDTTSPGYTDRQGDWWNVLVGLLRDAETVMFESGYPHWMNDGAKLARTLGVLEN